MLMALAMVELTVRTLTALPGTVTFITRRMWLSVESTLMLGQEVTCSTWFILSHLSGLFANHLMSLSTALSRVLLKLTVISVLVKYM